MAYGNDSRNNTLYPRTCYALYIGRDDNGTGHLIFKISTKQILTTLKNKPVPMPEDLIEAINETDSFATNIQIDHCDSDHYIAQEDHFDTFNVNNHVFNITKIKRDGTFKTRTFSELSELNNKSDFYIRERQS